MPDNVNRISLANLYPDERSTTTAQQGSEQNPANTSDPSDSATGAHPTEQTFAMSLRDNPVYGWLGLLILLLVGLWVATKFSGGKPAANVRFSLFNLIMVPLLAIVGGSIAKVGVQWIGSRGYKLPLGIGTVILSS